jgi:hypothetical protein
MFNFDLRQDGSKKNVLSLKSVFETVHQKQRNSLTPNSKGMDRKMMFAEYPTRSIFLSPSGFNWKDLIPVDSRTKIIHDLISKELSHKNLVLINTLIKSASLGIIPRDDRRLEGLRDQLIDKFSQSTPLQKKGNYEVFNGIIKELPLYKKIKNRGPIRHGILGFKDHIVRGDRWEKLGPAGDFPRTLHQLAHQVPALELGYICKAYAQYLRTNGNMNEFDRVIRENGVNFEEYFVKNAKRIAENAGKGSSWLQISPDKPKGILNVSDEDMKRAFAHRGWTGKNVDELMGRNESKTATFFDTYGDIVIETLRSYGFSIFDGNKELEKTLNPRELGALKEIEEIRKKMQDPKVNEQWKENKGYPDLLKLSTNVRKEVIKEITQTNNPNKIKALISLDNNLESIVDTASINVLSKAKKEVGLLYKIEDKTKNLLLYLMDNYALGTPQHQKEFNLLTRDIHEIFNAPHKGSKEWAEKLIVPLNRLDRLVQKISKDISDQYRPIALNLAKHNEMDPSALRKVDQLSDGILRGSLLFPISQIYAGFKSEARKLSGGSPWQIVSPGEKIGKILFADNMEHLEEIISKNNLSKERLVCFVDTLSGAEEPPHGVTGIITPKVVDTLAHIGVRARQEDIGFACIDDFKMYEEIKKRFSSNESYGKLQIKDGQDIEVKPLSKNQYEKMLEDEKKVEVEPVKVVLPKGNLDDSLSILDLSKINLEKSGPKATNIAKLATQVPIPPSLSVPFGIFQKVLHHSVNRGILSEYNKTLQIVDRKQKENDISVSQDLEVLKGLVKKLTIPKDIEAQIINSIKKAIPEGTKYVMTRSSTNGEDLANFSGAGLYSSQPNPINEIINGIKIVWASKWNKRAFDARVKAEIPHEDLHVAVLIQPCIDTKYGFVTHTANPITKNPKEVFIEMVQGQNEALVSGKIPGTGYGFVYNKETGNITRTHLADKSYQFLPSDDGGTRLELADYKNDILAGDKSQWESMVREIGEYSVKIEKMYQGVPQDIEGVIEPQKLKTYIVQTRDQLGLK